MALLGVDIGGTTTSISLGDGNGSILRWTEFVTSEIGGPDAVIDRIVHDARRLLGEAGMEPDAVAGVGIACGGPLDAARGMILSPPNLPGWDRVPITDWIEAQMDVPAHLMNDADANALAEWRWGAGRGCNDFAYLTFGTGLGAGLILNGRLHTGPRNLAGEIGHIRAAEHGPAGHGKEASFEGFASGGSMPRLLRYLAETEDYTSALLSEPKLSAARISGAARAGDPLARRALEVCAEYLGRAASLLVDLLDLERVIVGGMFLRDEDLLGPVARGVLEREVLATGTRTCEIIAPALGEAIGRHGALAAATELDRCLSTTPEAADDAQAILERLLHRHPELSSCRREIQQTFSALRDCYESGGKVLICGNGGSAADADHIAGELMKGFLKRRPLPRGTRVALQSAGGDVGAQIAGGLQVGLPTLSLSGHPALISAFANDVDPELVYAQQVFALATRSDIVMGISTSGNSRNIVAALETARAIGARTIGLTGRGGGRMKTACDICIRVPGDETADVQELHLPVYHTLCAMVEAAFFRE